jgi:hypothetical protein
MAGNGLVLNGTVVVVRAVCELVHPATIRARIISRRARSLTLASLP